ENPFLEVGEAASEDVGGLPSEGIGFSEEKRQNEKDFRRLEELSDYFERLGEDTVAMSRRGSEEQEEDRQEFLQETAAATNLHDYLLEQLRFLDLDDEMRKVSEQIIYSIDNEGYLRTSVEELASECLVPVEVVERALSVVQTLEPPGVGARNLVEALLLQVRDEKRYELERRIIREHLEDVMHNRLPRIAKETGETLERVREAVEFIRHLHPKPGTLIGGEGAPPLLVDAVIEKIGDKYEVFIKDANIPPLRLSSISKELLDAAKENAEVLKYLRRRYERAQSLIRDIELRRLRLRMIVEEIVKEQTEFLEHGVEHLKPLTMRRLAHRLNLHISTVSRAIANKYVQTPQGVFPLKFFFTATPLKSRSGGECSSISVRERIRELIEKEDPRNPLSDDELVKILAQEKFDIARRTVAKYRAMLGIASSRQRKRY
ncbi:MAG: RNA polymerase factor sigma-54, partial [Planctomycetota bacterium]|nr:RNA polymerase factor sigma-54 [Planctomycetota bacterium]